MVLIIDVQGFKSENNKFLVKELAAFDGTRTCHYLFKSPYSFDSLPKEYQKQANWLTTHHHAIEWTQGYTRFHHFADIIKHLTADVKEVYVKGKEKAKFIQGFTKTCVVELPESPPLTPSNSCCFYHSKEICICALSNVYYLHHNFVMN